MVERQSLGNRFGINLRIQLFESGCKALEVGAIFGGRNIRVRREARKSVQSSGERSNQNEADLVLVQDPKETLGVERRDVRHAAPR
jgi:hypothetical protein